MDKEERIARVNAVWEQMNSGLPAKVPKSVFKSSSTTVKKPTQKGRPEWMVALGISPKKTLEKKDVPQKCSVEIKKDTSEEAKRIAAAALSAVKEASPSGRGKIEVSEVKDFAGKDIEVKRFVDADSKEAAERAKASGAPPSALDNILEQIRKKPKLSVLDKTKMDWGGYKEENKGLGEELDAYKKSSNQYLDKVSFLQRTDLREFEHERDARLSLHSKRRPDMREGDD